MNQIVLAAFPKILFLATFLLLLSFWYVYSQYSDHIVLSLIILS